MTAVYLNAHTGRTAGRFAKALAMAGGDHYAAAAVASAQGWSDGPQIAQALKATVDYMTTADLAAAMIPVEVDFAAATRPRTIIGRLQGMRRVIASTRTLTGGGAVGRFVGEGEPLPISEMDFASGVSLVPTKCGAIVVATLELGRSASPDAEEILGNDLAGAVADAINVAFLDPLNDGTNDAPASILNGATAIPSSGSTLAAIDADLRALLQTFEDDLASGYFVISRNTFTFLSLLRGSGGGKAYPELAQGQLLGVPVLTSSAARHAGSPGGSFIALIDAAEILIADEGRSMIDTSDAATLQMTSTPVPGAAPALSLFQSNLIGFKALRWLRWQRRRPGAAAYISGLTF